MPSYAQQPQPQQQQLSSPPKQAQRLPHQELQPEVPFSPWEQDCFMTMG
jgi:hypothetical protein